MKARNVELTEVQVNMIAFNANAQFYEPFNQCTFFNYDIVNAVKINDLIIPPASAGGGFVFPTSFGTTLNAGEVNTTNFNLSFGQGQAGLSDTANLQIVYTQYLGIPNS
jgi:hypothetical protein